MTGDPTVQPTISMELNEYLSESHRKRKKSRKRITAFVYGAVGALVCVGLFWIVLCSPIFQIRKIVITGNTTVTSHDILILAQTAYAEHGHDKFLGINNLLAWPSSFTTSERELEPGLSDIELAKNYFSRTLTVTVEERQPVAVWCAMPNVTGSDEECYWFDATGDMYARTFDATGDLILSVHDYSQGGLGLGKKITAERFIPNMLSILKVLSQSGLSIKEIRLNDISLEEIQITTYEGPDIYFSLRFPADDTLTVLRSVMAQPNFGNLQYVDFRTQGRAYYE